MIFGHDILIDGRKLDRPCNYFLMQIRPPEGLTIDPTKRPVVVVDPRAGQGPGVGGFKLDSEIGFALRAGHAVYFIGFYPEPVPGQTLVDIGAAESRFLEEVIRRHPGAGNKPCVIGNCQAGWAVAALAAVRPELTGPVAFVGAPLSYWAGADSQNPMRYNGGPLGGTWPSNLLADLGNGIVDGAWFVQNFENLDPAHSLWKKPYDLYSRVDTEEQRFLDFERWWGGYYLMTKEEIREIVDNLFAGNRLAGGIKLPNGQIVDLKNITAPVVVFASWGDNISPPQQALNWIVDVYGHEDAIVAQGRVIVYLLAEDVGHLSIFVGGRVAKKEHRELISVMEMLDELPPGLYEIVIEQRPKHGVPQDLDRDTYTVRFETRTVDDIRALNPDRRTEESLFSTVKQVSEINEQLYERVCGPMVRALSNEATARLCACCTRCESGSTCSRTSTRRSRCYRWSPSRCGSTGIRPHRTTTSCSSSTPSRIRLLALSTSIATCVILASSRWSSSPTARWVWEPSSHPSRLWSRKPRRVPSSKRRRSSPPCAASSSGAAFSRRSSGC